YYYTICTQLSHIIVLSFPLFVILLFFFNDTPTTEIYTLSLHDALPISQGVRSPRRPHGERPRGDSKRSWLGARFGTRPGSALRARRIAAGSHATRPDPRLRGWTGRRRLDLGRRPLPPRWSLERGADP